MKYLSVCDGIGAVHIWHERLKWECVGTSEIAAFPAAVVEQRYGFENYGDFTKIQKKDGPRIGPVELLVGGTPCQTFSIAGLRAGMDDARGNLALEFLALAQRLRCKWVVWENVPGVLSIDKGRAFGSILGGLAELGYGWAYRILDAQHFGVPQRRRRVFVVGYLGDWRRAAAVLFERESLSGNTPPRREAGQIAANALTDRPDRGGTNSEGQRLVSATLTSGAGSGRSNKPGRRQEDDTNIVLAKPLGSHHGRNDNDNDNDTYVAPCLDAHYGEKYGLDNQHINSGGGFSSVAKSLNSHGGRFDSETETFITHAPTAVGHDASEDGTGRGTPLCVFDTTQITSKTNQSRCEVGNPCHTLGKGQQPPAIAEIAPTLTAPGKAGARQDKAARTVTNKGVRRLTPRECERLQGFADDHTLITFKKKPAADSPRYEAIGNSMARPVMLWIGQRIQQVEDLTRE